MKITIKTAQYVDNFGQARGLTYSKLLKILMIILRTSCYCIISLCFHLHRSLTFQKVGQGRDRLNKIKIIPFWRREKLEIWWNECRFLKFLKYWTNNALSYWGFTLLNIIQRHLRIHPTLRNTLNLRILKNCKILTSFVWGSCSFLILQLL